MPSRGGVPTPPPALAPTRGGSQHAPSNVGASQPHGTAKLGPAPPRPLAYGLSHAVSNVGRAVAQAPHSVATPHGSGGFSRHAPSNVGASQPHGTAKLGPTRQQRQSTAALQSLLKGKMTTNDVNGGGGMHIGAITVPDMGTIDLGPLLHETGKVAGNLGSDALNAVPNLGKGAIQLGLAGWDDLTHGRLGQNNGLSNFQGGSSHLDQAANTMAKNDALAQLVSGHPERALQLAIDHPLNAIMDFTGAAGVAGRVAGMGARTGAFGSKLAASASTAPVEHELVPGLPGSAVMRTPSSNLFRAIADRHGVTMPNPLNLTRGRKLDLSRASRAMRKQAALQYGSDTATAQRLFRTTAKNLKATKPSGRTEANVVQYPAAFGAGHLELPNGGGVLLRPRATLQHFHDLYEAARGTPAAATTTGRHLDNLRAALSKPNLDQAAIDHAAQTYASRQAGLEGLKAQYGLRSVDEMQRALEKQYAAEQMPGAKIVPPESIPSIRSFDARSLLADKKTAEKAFAKAGVDHAVNLGKARVDARAGIIGARQNLTRLRSAEGATRQAISTQYGADALHSAEGALGARGIREAPKSASPTANGLRIPDHVAMRLHDNMNAVDSAAKALHDAQQHGARLIAETKQYGVDVLTATKSNAKDAQLNWATLGKPYAPEKVGGLVTHDPGMPPIRTGQYAGEQLRPLTSAEVHAHMAAHGHDPSYMNMRLAEEQRPQAITMHDLVKPPRHGAGANNAVYSGRAAHTGAQIPGWAGLANSQLSDVSRIGYAMKRQNFLDRFALKNHPLTGEPIDERNLADAQRALHVQTGLDSIAVHDPVGDRVVLLPKPYADEYAAQAKLDNPSKVAKLAMRSNRLFTAGTLAMSPKLPVMHTVENATKSALAGVTPLDLAYFHRVTSKMTPEALARLKQLAAPGTMSHSVSQLGGEDLGRMVGEQGALNKAKAVAGALPRAADLASHGIIKGQRITELPAQWAVLGQFLRRTASATGRTPEEMAKLMEQPKWQEAAAAHNHQALGKWNNYTAGPRWVSRVAPFSPWTGNAFRYAAKTMPTAHPLQTAALLDTAAANKKGWDAAHKSLPTDAQFSVMLKNVGHALDVGKFLPIPVHMGGKNVPDFLANSAKDAASLLAPQWSAVAQGLTGNDGFWNNIRDAHGNKVPAFSARALLHGLEALGETHAPIAAALARIAQDRGGTLTADSLPLFGDTHMKPGSQHGLHGLTGGLLKQFNPFRGTYFSGSSGGRRSTGPRFGGFGGGFGGGF